MTWITRGRKPERNIEAAALGFLEGFFKGILAKDPNPLVRGGATALGAVVANDKHRLVDRARAKDTADTLIDRSFKLAKAATPLLAAQNAAGSQPSATVAFTDIRNRVRAAGVRVGFSGVVGVPLAQWQQMSDGERSRLTQQLAGLLQVMDGLTTVVVFPSP